MVPDVILARLWMWIMVLIKLVVSNDMCVDYITKVSEHVDPVFIDIDR